MKYSYKISDEETIILDELKFKDYKKILKVSYGDEVTTINFVETLLDVLVNNTDKPKQYFLTLNICDVLNLLIELRANSMGNTASILIPKEDKQVRVDLRLDWIQQDVKSFTNFCSKQVVEFDGIKLHFGIPSIAKLLSVVSEEEQFLCFLAKAEAIALKGQVFDITDIEDARKILNTISAKDGKTIIDSFQKIVEHIYNQNFLSRYKIETNETLRFIPSLSSVLWYIKMLFNEPLDSLYHNIFMLAKYGNIDPSYIEECTPGEYIFFTKKLEEALTAENSDVPSSDGYSG